MLQNAFQGVFYLKRYISLMLALLICLPFCGMALADVDDMNKTVSAPGFVCIDASDPTNLIYAKNPDRKLAPASTTKIMTCILTLEACPDLDEIVEVDPAATRLGSSNTLMGLKKGESLPVRDLLYGLMLPSGNDAAIALACHIAGSVEQFAAMMNDKAVELGMQNTNFVTASGVFKSNHYSTARDMALLTAYAMQNETFRQIVSTPNYTVPANEVREKSLYLENTNNLIQPKKSEYYEYAIGCKTGSTVQGGKCLVAAAEKDDVTIIVVLLGLTEGGTKGQRIHKCFKDAQTVFRKVFDRYQTLDSSEIDLPSICGDLSIETENYRDNDPQNGILQLNTDFSGQHARVLDESYEALRSGAVVPDVTVSYVSDPCAAPIAKGDILGSVTVSLGEKILFSSGLTASRDVEEFRPEDHPTPLPSPTPSPVIPEQEPARELDSHTLMILMVLALLVILLIVASALLFVHIRKNRSR